MIESLFKSLCPNCGGDITSERLEAGLPCKNCMPESNNNQCTNLRLEGEFKKLCLINQEVKDWEKYFEKNIKAKPWSLQISWAKRVFLGNCFALLAPTGVGKSSFGICMAGLLAEKGKTSYIILPTKMLVNQVVKRLLEFGFSESQLLFFLEETPKQKEKKMERLVNKDFKILITTSMFLYKNQERIPKGFDFIFVDDVDSFLKTAKNIDKVLYLLGFSQEDVRTTMDLIKLKEKIKKTDQEWETIKELSEKVKTISEKRKGVLVVSSATSNPKSSRIKLFRELLGFEVGTPTFYLRNVIDLYVDIKECDLEKWIKELGPGGLVFVSSDKGKEYVQELVKELQDKGILAFSYEDINDKVLKDYEEKKVQVLVGIASYKNPLARGFDMPHVVRYAIFYGVPKLVISLKFEKSLPHLLWALVSIRGFIAKYLPNKLRQLDYWLEKLKRYQYFTEELQKNDLKLNEKINRVTEEVVNFLSSQEIINLLETSDEITLRKTEEGYYMVISDATGYLQASGRTSRMFAGGISLGLSLVLVDDKRAFKHLMKKVRWFNEDIRFKHVKDVEIKQIKLHIDEDRERIKRFIKGEEKQEDTQILKPVLIVVESPNKAKTIANFFGKPVRRKVGEHDLLETSIEDRYLMITASLGHILDLNKEEGFHGVHIDKKIVPVYESIEGKEGIIKSLRRMALEVQEVLIATDPDTEGEKIGWDIKELLKPYVKDIKRMEFHEVTRRAIVKALKSPRDFNLDLVKAQIVRRVADRWVGFEFSRLLQESFRKTRLSAGRVQTPVLGWIIEREKEYRKKIYKVILYLSDDRKLKVEFKFQTLKEAKDLYDSIENFYCELLEEKEEVKNPPPPFTTDSMLKLASDRYKWPLQKTMEIAQTLFELGFITYHRTDSTRVSEYGIAIANEYISEEFGKNYFYPRTWSEGGAHECIRPTKNIDPEELKAMLYSGHYEGLTKEHLALYELVFKQFMASQMKPVKLKVSYIKVKAKDKSSEINVPITIIEEGYNKLLPIEVYTPPFGEISSKNKKELRIESKAYLYTHGELVQEMKRKGIGRPSTYATIVEKLLERGYIIEKKGSLIPTKLGKKVYNYLKAKEEVHEFLKEEFTRHLEELMDKIEEGKEDYNKILLNLYEDIIKVEKRIKTI